MSKQSKKHDQTKYFSCSHSIQKMFFQHYLFKLSLINFMMKRNEEETNANAGTKIVSTKNEKYFVISAMGHEIITDQKSFNFYTYEFAVVFFIRFCSVLFILLWLGIVRQNKYVYLHASNINEAAKMAINMKQVAQDEHIRTHISTHEHMMTVNSSL